MAKNHFALNMITKGVINPSSLITKGIIAMCTYELIKDGRKVGSGDLAAPYSKRIYDEIKRTDADTIKVYVQWNKNIDKNKKVTAELIKKEISVELLKNNIDINIEIDLMD